MRLLAAEPRSTSGLSFPCQYLCGTILVTPYSMVWDWRVSRAGPMPFYWPICSLPFCLLLFSLSLLSFYGLVLWGWGLRTDRVLIALSQPYSANFINDNNNDNSKVFYEQDAYIYICASYLCSKYVSMYIYIYTLIHIYYIDRSGSTCLGCSFDF